MAWLVQRGHSGSFPLQSISNFLCMIDVISIICENISRVPICLPKSLLEVWCCSTISLWIVSNRWKMEPELPWTWDPSRRLRHDGHDVRGKQVAQGSAPQNSRSGQTLDDQSETMMQQASEAGSSGEASTPDRTSSIETPGMEVVDPGEVLEVTLNHSSISVLLFSPLFDSF